MDITTGQAAAELLSHDNITILCHRKPDGDTLGSGYALHKALTQLGRRSVVRCADPCPPGMAEFMTRDNCGDFSQDYVVAVDVADSKLLGTLEDEYAGRVDMVIDHHPSNTHYGKKTLLLPEAAATTEIVAGLLPFMQVELTAEIATCLYVGLATDTGCFRYANTTASTLRTAAVMLEAGINCGELNRVLFETKSPGRVAVECSILQGLEYFYHGQCAVMTIPMALQELHDVEDSELDGLAALPRQIEGVWVGVTIREKPDDCRISVRTTKEADSSAICAAFGGGGHLRASGCTIEGSVEHAKELLVEEIGRQLCIPG